MRTRILWKKVQKVDFELPVVTQNEFMKNNKIHGTIQTTNNYGNHNKPRRHSQLDTLIKLQDRTKAL